MIIQSVFQSVSDLPEYLAGPLNMLIILPEIMQWSGVISILSSFIIIFILMWKIFHNKSKNNPAEGKNERNPTILKKTADYDYCKVPLKEASSDNAKC